MPRVRYLPPRHIPREQDSGYLFALCRDAGIFLQRPTQRAGEYIIRGRGIELFRGSVPECVAFLRQWLAGGRILTP